MAAPFTDKELEGFRRSIPGALAIATGRDATEIRCHARFMATIDALIVRAVNSHESLVALLEEAAVLVERDRARHEASAVGYATTFPDTAAIAMAEAEARSRFVGRARKVLGGIK